MILFKNWVFKCIGISSEEIPLHISSVSEGITLALNTYIVQLNIFFELKNSYIVKLPRSVLHFARVNCGQIPMYGHIFLYF